MMTALDVWADVKTSSPGVTERHGSKRHQEPCLEHPQVKLQNVQRDQLLENDPCKSIFYDQRMVDCF